MWKTTVLPDNAVSCATACAWSKGLPTASPSQSATWSEPMTSASGYCTATLRALASASRSAVADGTSPGSAVSSVDGDATTNGSPS